MIRRVNEKRGAAVIIWILVIAVVAMALLIIIPVIVDVDGSRAKAQDEAHEQVCWDSALMENIGVTNFDAVYDYYEKRFVKLTEHPYKVKPYGNTKEHQDCVIMVHCNGTGNIEMSWISRSTLRARYR